jgi:tetratricopeptide (TPR) repeat protein
MAADRQKQLQHAERLLKQGKVQAAMLELERLADGAPSDVLTLNRIGDLLAKQGRKDEAIRFYNKIAEQFTNSGFLPKAVAIHKKVLRLNPNYIQSLVALGQLYFQQKLPGEARTHMLRAADQYLQVRNFTKAREVYEKLVAAEPDDPRHKARLAEARAAEGETGTAGEELLQLADTLVAQGQAGEAEQTYRRAQELLPGREEPVVGLARCLGEIGRNDEALQLLDQAEKEHGGSTLILGERVLRYELAGRGRDAVELLKLPFASEIADDVFVRIFRFHRDHDGLDSLWKRLDPVFDRWRAADQLDRLRSLLEGVAEIEAEGHVPALRRLLEVNRTRGDSAAVRQSLETLIAACRTRGLSDEVETWVEQLREISPGSAALSGEAATPAHAPSQVRSEPAAAPPQTQAPARPVATTAGDPPIEAEAPAVPLNRGDEEYVSGRLTQTEILEKYGLREQALQQVREVTEKFPGHVPAQQKLVELLREGSSPRELQDALVALALARRAEGDAAGAQAVCGEAAAIGPLDDGTTTMLAQLGLVDGAAPALDTPAAGIPLSPSEPSEEQTVSVEAEPVAVPPAPAGHDAAPPEVSSVAGGDDAVLIDFDADEDEEEVAAEPDSATPPPPSVEPVTPPAPPLAGSEAAAGEDVLLEIDGLLDDGEVVEARRRLEALETLGWVSERLSELKAKLERLEGERTVPVGTESSGPSVLGDESIEDIVDDDDLSAITAALEGELFADDAQPVSPEPESEQSLEEVFAAFKEQVDREVDDEDFRTHYDLGIAYKEMGLMDEAVSQFEQAVRSPELGREAYTMLALCHRERDELDAAARCYRQAISNSGSDSETLNSLRYELAELLLNTGDRAGALDEFRHLLEADPSYRDVQDRIASLESCPS